MHFVTNSFCPAQRSFVVKNVCWHGLNMHACMYAYSFVSRVIYICNRIVYSLGIFKSEDHD